MTAAVTSRPSPFAEPFDCSPPYLPVIATKLMTEPDLAGQRLLPKAANADSRPKRTTGAPVYNIWKPSL